MKYKFEIKFKNDNGGTSVEQFTSNKKTIIEAQEQAIVFSIQQHGLGCEITLIK
jgi:hypothetical protein